VGVNPLRVIAMAGQTACGKWWAMILASYEKNIDDLSKKFPDCIEQIQLIHAGLVTIGQLIHDPPHKQRWQHVETNNIKSRGREVSAL
jgi:hypothetical protein